jgi:hypothetical protein
MKYLLLPFFAPVLFACKNDDPKPIALRTSASDTIIYAFGLYGNIKGNWNCKLEMSTLDDVPYRTWDTTVYYNGDRTQSTAQCFGLKLPGIPPSGEYKAWVTISDGIGTAILGYDFLIENQEDCEVVQGYKQVQMLGPGIIGTYIP